MPRLAALVTVVVLGGCAAEADHAVKGAAKFAGFATETPPPTDFVAAARPAKIDYMAVGLPQPTRPSTPRPAPEVQAMEKSLEATRQGNEAAGKAAQAAGQTPAPKPVAVPPVAADADQ